MIKKILRKLFASKKKQLDVLKARGLVVGKNFSIQEGCIIDPDHCWHIEIGDNVTLAPRVHILAHDASSHKLVGYTKVKKVKIGNNVFIGAGCIVMPGVTIANDVVIGAGTVVYKNLLQDGVYVGADLRRICSIDEYKIELKNQMNSTIKFNSDYTLRNPNITAAMKLEMNEALEKHKVIFVE